MAKVANIVQPVRSRVLAPKSVYSRVIALELHLDAGIGNADFCFTEQLGNELWLLAVDVWAFCADPVQTYGGFFYFMQGTSQPLNQLEVATRWNFIIPLRCGIKPGFMWFCNEGMHRRFEMNKHYAFDGLRFGVTIENGFNRAFAATVAFQFSEG